MLLHDRPPIGYRKRRPCTNTNHMATPHSITWLPESPACSQSLMSLIGVASFDESLADTF